ncbi:polysaccharide biosynthesis protein [Candidatus Daviesbacteria bacterium]|nr:polysaccharide biosynthesis protein [Candidatus Daviesbacteria bacterium]
MDKDFSKKIKDKQSLLLHNKVILITGGTGSFGTAVVAKLLSFTPKRIIIFSRDEKKQFDMRNFYDSPLLKFVIGDVRDKESLDKVMSGVDYVFHAAALKQVPSCEFFPIEAVKTNVLGANNVIELAEHHNVERLVILSTDKAVYPINAMGMTKALMEKVMIAAARKISEANNKSTTLCGVRYGNVMYSRGSVIPYFVDLIKQGKPLAVTDLNMTRFLLPLPDSVDLVLFALTFGENGNMYVRKSSASTIEILAKALCKIFDHKTGIQEVGVRAGEKIHETLVSEEEFLRAKDLGDYYKIPSETQGLDYNKYFIRGREIEDGRLEPFTSENTRRLSLKETIELLMTLPEIQQELKNLS